MNAKQNQSPESAVREIRGNTRRKYSTEEKIRIVLEGLKGEVSIDGVFNHSYTTCNILRRIIRENTRQHVPRKILLLLQISISCFLLIGQFKRLITRRSGVQIPSPLPNLMNHNVLVLRCPVRLSTITYS